MKTIDESKKASNDIEKTGQVVPDYKKEQQSKKIGCKVGGRVVIDEG